MVACPFAGFAAPIVGAPGTVNGVTLLEAAEVGLTPTPLVAVTVKVYAVPFARPGTTIGAAAGPATLAEMPPGVEVAV